MPGRCRRDNPGGWHPQPNRAADPGAWAADLSAQHPEWLAEQQALFLYEAEKNHALPIDDRVFERILPANVGRPDLIQGRTSLTRAEGMTGMTENVFLNIKNRSKTITAEVGAPDEAPANG